MTDLSSLIIHLQDSVQSLNAPQVVSRGSLFLLSAFAVLYTLAAIAAPIVLLTAVIREKQAIPLAALSVSASVVICGLLLVTAISTWQHLHHLHVGSKAEIQQAQAQEETVVQATCSAIFEGFRDQRFHLLDSGSQELVEHRCGVDALLRAANRT